MINNYQLSDIHISLKNEFVNSLPSEELVHLSDLHKINYNHTITRIMSNVFEKFDINNGSIDILAINLKAALDKCSNNDKNTQIAIKILDQVSTFYTNSTREFFKILPFEVSDQILNFKLLKPKDLMAFLISSKASLGLAHKDYLKIASIIYRSELLLDAFCSVAKLFEYNFEEIKVYSRDESRRRDKIFSKFERIECTLEETSELFLEKGKLNRSNPEWDLINPLTCGRIKKEVKINTNNSLLDCQELILECKKDSRKEYQKLANVLEKIYPFIVSLKKLFA